MFEKLGKFKLLVGLIAVILLIAIPLTVSQLQKKQENRSHAGGGAISIILTPLSSNINVGDTFDVNVTMDSAGFDISALDITGTYDPNLLEPVMQGSSFPPGFATVTADLNTNNGTGHYVGVNPTLNPITGSSINLGIMRFKAKATGTATVGFSNIHVNASGVNGALPVDTDKTKNGEYTIAVLPTVSCTTPPECPPPPPNCSYSGANSCSCGTVVCPTDSVTPTCAPRPGCLDTTPRCMMPEPIGGWCPPSSTPTTTPTTTVTPTTTPTTRPTPTPTPTLGPGETGLKVFFRLPGIGADTAHGQNNSPQHSTRPVEIKLIDSQNNELNTIKGGASYGGDSTYTGSINLGTLPQGQYTIKIRTYNTLWKRVPEIVSLAPNIYNPISKPVDLVSGDFNQDNSLDILDFNKMISCSRGITNIIDGCSVADKSLVDLNDDGVINDSLDVAILLANFAHRTGD